ncbi:MAG: M1 family aminopeptidase [Acidobacteriota bacterium]
MQAACVVAWLVMAAPAQAQTRPAPRSQPELTGLLAAFRSVVQNGDVDGYLRLVAPASDSFLALSFARGLFGPGGATRVAVVLRDRVPRVFRDGTSGASLAVDVLIERGPLASIYTCKLDVVPPDVDDGSVASGQAWRILAAEQLTGVEGLERLALDPSIQYRARNLVVRAEDVEFRLVDGYVFVARSGDRISAAVLLGDGEMIFRPSLPGERSQVRIFSGSDTLRARFDAIYLRLSSADADQLLGMDRLTLEPVDRKLLDRSTHVFADEAEKSFVVDLGDLSTDRWWVRPQPGDLVAEVRTRKYGTLTYARSWKDHEDVTLFDRQRRRHIAVYASPEKLAQRGRFYDERDGREYEVRHYDVDAAFAPDRQWIQGRTRLSVTALADNLTRLTLRLADGLEVESVWTAQHGRVLGLRVRHLNSLLVALPKPVVRGADLDVVVTYKGRLAPQATERDTRSVAGTPAIEFDDYPPMPIEAAYLYSNRSYWYAQAADEGYATARIRISVPVEYTCVASGELVGGGPLTSGVVGQTGPSAAQRVYTFEAARPIKYLAFVASRFVHLDQDVAPVVRSVGAPAPAPTPPPPAPALRLSAEVASRFRSDGQASIGQAAAMGRFYTEIAGGSPYPSFTLALIEDDLPGGHSPAYFAVLSRAGRTGRAGLNWSADPAAFADYPEYFLAHELAHQWWGQAVGTKNYHEQWISEGFAQYFAALYAERSRGAEAYGAIIRQFRKFAVERSTSGPVYLGARLGHIQNDSRIFRALVYNKGALVLHMLRRLLGDDVFFRGLRRVYGSFQFRHAGTDDVRQAFEVEAGRPLDRFFERWIYGDALPTLNVTTSIEPSGAGSAVTIRAEQGPLLFDVPVTVALELADGTTRSVVLVVGDQVSQRRVTIEQPVRRAWVLEGELPATLLNPKSFGAPAR